MASSRFLFAFVLLLCLGGMAAAQPVKTMRVRGVVTAVDDSMVSVKSRDGAALKIALDKDWGVLAVSKIAISAIKPGSFVGVAALPQAGGEPRALEVLVFPEAARGSNEGHYPWDLMPESTMTNATVAAVVEGNSGRELSLTYKGGTQKILVPADVPIVTFAPDERSLLVPGAAIFCGATVGADGGLSLKRVLVGKNGTVPPM